MTPGYSTDFSNKKTLEKFSSAFTLSDMEIFIFPELFYPLVLANIMSPLIWEWRDDPWFKGVEKKSFTYKTNRIKQFIIQNYVFNLDLSTWGLTTKGQEIERFKDFFDMDLLKQSNALFGYEGDKYYFDIDIRKHFGLDKYDTEVIPYWKTETIEAMTAFRFKENFSTGAGECVSLSSLYAAAMFVIGRIPLEKIFLVATPLHSQNFIIEKEGLITNNRRIVTKNMWFNGTSLSAKARRAMENEKVTIVTNISGYIHTLYDEATIDSESYKWFSQRLREFLKTDLTNAVFLNFLRFKSRYKSLFQFRCECSGIKRYISLEKMFEYEHNSKYSVSKETREHLIKDIEGDEFHLSPLNGKIMLNDIEDLLNEISHKSLDEIENEFFLRTSFEPAVVIHEMFNEIREFICTNPKIPEASKEYIKTKVPSIGVENSRKEIFDAIYDSAGESELSLLTLYVYRQMDKIDWLPFIKASLERNPVCFLDLNGKSINEVYNIIETLDNHSIYDGNRLAMPDEVWNYRRGDGIEKAILLADFILKNEVTFPVKIKIDHSNVTVEYDNQHYQFKSEKKLRKTIEVNGNNYKIE
ncbi:MAG: hypothetical protein C0408_00760 [Odoribacter sp.]|nr:hypothetical protein [Odoribacter sp.]